MRIEQLEYLTEVARLGSSRRAAEALHISQPALSASVRSLERELGVDLLERGRQGAKVSDPRVHATLLAAASAPRHPEPPPALPRPRLPHLGPVAGPGGRPSCRTA